MAVNDLNVVSKKVGMAIRAWPAGPVRRPVEKTRGGPG